MFQVMYQDMHSAKASMLQDLEKGKKTEVSMIDGFVCQTVVFPCGMASYPV